MPESLYGCRSDAVKLSGFVNQRFCFAKSSVNGPSMSMTTDCWTNSTARDVYSTVEFAKIRNRPRFNIGAASKPALASAPHLSPSRRFKSFLSGFTGCSVVRNTSWTINHMTWSSPCVFPAIDNNLSVDEHVINTEGINKRLFIRGAVLDSVVVEDDNVGPAAFFDNAARVESHAGGGPGGHLANRVFEGQDWFLSNVASDETRKVAVTTWMTKT